MTLRFRPLFAALALLASLAQGQAPPSAQPAAPGDPFARMFLDRCAGCHTVGAGARTGPDLLPSTAWKADALAPAVKRMEKNVGPLSDADVAGIVGFMKDAKVRDRIAAEEERAAKQAAATLEPASPSLGRMIFLGEKSLRNGGSNCAACHSAAGLGGSLGPDLTRVHARLGETGLVSAIEKSGFRLMKPIYARHPVTKQEAAHLAAYFASIRDNQPGPSREAPVGLVGAALWAGVMALVAVVFIRRRPGTRARLLAQGTRR